MFALIESSRTVAVTEGWSGKFGSFALHSLLIATAVMATRHAQVRPPNDQRPSQTLIWDQQPTPRRGSPVPAPPGVSVKPPPTLAIPNVPPQIPPVTEPVTSFTLVDSMPVRPGPVVVGGTPGTPGGSDPGPAPFEPRYVEEQPVLLSHPPLRYPELLRQAGIEGRIVVEAVLDTLGYAERGSLRIAQGGQAPFEAEALAVVRASTYRPGRVSGHAVRVRVQVPIVFAIRR